MTLFLTLVFGRKLKGLVSFVLVTSYLPISRAKQLSVYSAREGFDCIEIRMGISTMVRGCTSDSNGCSA